MINVFHKSNLKKVLIESLFVQDALRNGLVATEVMMWFYIGECIGKGGIIGYNVWVLDCHAFSFFSTVVCWTSCKNPGNQ